MAAATNMFTVGRDGVLRIILFDGTQLSDVNYTDFKSEQVMHTVMSRPLNSPTLPAQLPDHWTMEFGLDRTAQTLEAELNASELSYWTGGALNTVNCTVFQFVTNPDNSQSTYTYVNATIKLSNAGEYKQDQIVHQTLSCIASQRFGA